MTDRETALRMLHELIASETAICKQAYSGRIVSQVKWRVQQKAMQAIFRALTGESATTQELQEASE